MHPDLSPHLHSPECNELIRQLKNCHEENTFGKFIGVCNEIKTKLDRCLKAEREENRKTSREKGLAMKNRIAKQKETTTAN